ncbi:unnamed protein product [Rotaria sp. Silwood1]|nr:unnamed protein product [Rotaria sp. Silwood1]
MYRFSYKVNQRRLSRKLKRQSVGHIIVSDNDSSDENYVGDNGEQLELHSFEETSFLAVNIHDISFSSRINNVDDEINWESDEEYEGDQRPLYNGSSITVINAVHRITNFYLNNNLDKQKVNSLLRLIKHLLPKPNLLPSTLKRIKKFLNHVPPTSTKLLCSDCYHLCSKPETRTQTCINPKCTTSFRPRRATEIIEIVRFDVRTQIQSIMHRNATFINKPQYFPPSDICFGQQYQQMAGIKHNKITLILHSDGAPIVHSSKKSIWPCFASITEIPPPMREFQSNIITLALWLSKKKPNVNIFLDETINDLSLLIRNGTSIFIDNEEYKIQLDTQFFIADLPAKSVFCCTTYFNGYSACTFCCSRGIWSSTYNKVLYPYKNNNLTARTHDSYIKAAEEAILKSNRGKEVAVDGIKNFSSLLRIFKYPTQIIYDFMHLVCLGHIPYLINRWCSFLDKKSILDIDKKLQDLCIPHNMKVIFLESITMASHWKAKNSRLFVLHVGVPVMLNKLPNLLFSHFVIYSLAIKLLYAPDTKDDIIFAERLIDYYCRTASMVHDTSIEIFSLHAHLHLAYQVRLHGGLAHTSAFVFESVIKYIKKKAHGSFNLASQIAYWINIRHAVNSNKYKLPQDCLINIMMNENNLYSRNYTSKRKTIEHNETYHVIIFPCDNSFSVVKAKQCAPAEQDGFVMVHSGGKKYMGFIFETGSFQICSKAADLLSQKQHDAIESDYERGNENTLSNDINSNVSDVPFSIDVITNESNERSPRHTISDSTNVNHAVTPIRGKAGGGWQRTRNEYCGVAGGDINVALTTTSSRYCTNSTPISSSKNDNDLILIPGTPTSHSIPSTTVRKRPIADSVSSSRKKKKKKRENIQEDDNISSCDAESDEDNIIHSIDSIKTPTFHGRRLNNASTIDSTPDKPMNKDSFFQYIETKYLTQLLIGQERLEARIKSIYKNQIKIQKALNKRQIHISLEEPGNVGVDDADFPSSVIFKLTEDEPGVDLLNVHGTKEKANLYVTTLIQLMYTIEELAALAPADTYNDKRYMLIKEAVRVKFKLNEEQLEQMFNEWLREVFLAKRRVAVAKLKNEKQ